VSAGQQVEVDEHEQIVERVAAIDVAKVSGMVCTRVPHATKAGRRVTTVWEVPSTTTAILELAEQLAGQGVQRGRGRVHLRLLAPVRLSAGGAGAGGVPTRLGCTRPPVV
jgi:hypothetical protein